VQRHRARPLPDYPDEIAELSFRFGAPRLIEAPIPDGFASPIYNERIDGEVCFVVRRPNGNILLSIKPFYPPGAYRLPTGGIEPGERLLDAVRREAHEETGLDTDVSRFLAAIRYQPLRDTSVPAIFQTFAFLLDERGGTLGSLDPHEPLEYREVAPAELAAVADQLERTPSAYSTDLDGDWSDWGRFRAVVHRVVADAFS
jgi:8-oxo-dGTP pyrophosphatase MutT (NUDIX family)